MFYIFYYKFTYIDLYPQVLYLVTVKVQLGNVVINNLNPQ